MIVRAVAELLVSNLARSFDAAHNKFEDGVTSGFRSPYDRAHTGYEIVPTHRIDETTNQVRDWE